MRVRRVASGGRLLDIPQRVRGEYALFIRPIECPLDRDHRIPPSSFPILCVQPVADVDRLQFDGGSAGVQATETLKEVLVQQIGGPLVVPFRVRQEQVAYLGGEDLGRVGLGTRVGTPSVCRKRRGWALGCSIPLSTSKGPAHHQSGRRDGSV